MSRVDQFTLCRAVEAMGHDMVQPLLKQVLKEFMPTHHAPAEYQRLYGDYIGTTAKSDSFISLELKTERANEHGNLFIETMSNVRLDDSRFGWIHTSRADLIWYSFLDERSVYVMRRDSLWDWCVGQGNMYLYPYKTVKSPQKNRTAGHCVPIVKLKEAKVIQQIWKEGEFDFEKVWVSDGSYIIVT